MDAAQRRKWLVTGGLAVLVVAAILLYYQFTGPEAPEQRSFAVNVVDTSNLDCPAKDLVFISQPQVLQRGLPSVATAAIQDQVTTTYRKVAPDNLEVVSSSATKATYAYKGAGGDTLAEVELSNTGTGWAVDSFVACDSFLETQV